MQMPTKNEAIPVGSIKERPDWDRTFELLRKRQYEQVAKFLYQAQLLSEQADNAILADILAAALHICWACSQFEAEVIRYRQAREEISRREHDLTQLLQAILDLVSGRDLPESPDDRTVPPLVLEAQRNLLEPYSSAAGNPNFLQRIQNLLGWGTSSQSLEREKPALSVKAQASAIVEEFEEPVTTFSEDKTETSIEPSPEEAEGSTVDRSGKTEGRTSSAEAAEAKSFVAQNKTPTTFSTEPIELSTFCAADAEEPTYARTEEVGTLTIPIPHATEVSVSALTKAMGQRDTPPVEAVEPTPPATSDKPSVSTDAAEALRPSPSDKTATPVPAQCEQTKEQPDRPEETKPQAIRSAEEAHLRTALSAEPDLPSRFPFSDELPDQQHTPTLVVYCLGTFKVYQDDRPIQNWISSKGKTIFKYLVTHRKRAIAKEVLMDLFWPDAKPDAARNNLNVAIYGLRQTLRQNQPEISHILFQDDRYLLNPELQFWIDVEVFMAHLGLAQAWEQRGELSLAIQLSRSADSLYRGEFLADDRYEEWLLPQRQRFEADYLRLLDRLSRYYFDQEDYDNYATMCEKMLTVDPSREEAHRRLMRYYIRQKQGYLALRQYHLCVEALASELDIDPSQKTVELYEQVRQGQ
jgi:DNA-binding SARP family transcriptional activator